LESKRRNFKEQHREAIMEKNRDSKKHLKEVLEHGKEVAQKHNEEEKMKREKIHEKVI
jgi:hypothetical protein